MLEKTFLESIKKYKEEVCSTCKTECNEGLSGICVICGKDDREGFGVQCVDYLKDETKIKPLEKPIIPTAKHTKPIMDKLV